jgi:hypothetical protein
MFQKRFVINEMVIAALTIEMALALHKVLH